MKCLIVAKSGLDKVVLTDTQAIYEFSNGDLRRLASAPENESILNVDIDQNGEIAYSTTAKQLHYKGRTYQ